MTTSYVTVTDQFCGAGGSSIGATTAGAELRLALNHWKLAIETHNTNFPNADHDCTDVSACDPRRYPSTTILLTSPECFPAGTLILTQRGLIPIEAVVVGDVALTHLNRWRPVVRTQSKVADTVIVSGQGNTVGIEVTPNHRFWVRKQTRKWNNDKRDYDRRIYEPAGWERVENLLSASYRWATPTEIEPMTVSAPPIFGLAQNLANAWWLIGRWLGDGSLSFGHNAEVVISCGYSEVDELAPRLEQTGADWRMHAKRTAMNFTLWSPELRDWLYLHFGHGAANKGLPAWVYSLTADERRALLDGYISADGHVSQRRTRADTVSKKLAIGMRLLAEGLGFRAGVYRYEQHAREIEGRQLNVLPIYAVAWENNASARSAFEEDGKSWGLVKAIEPGRQQVTVYNLEVEEDHSYIADGIVVANCTNHSLAKGKVRKMQAQLELFGKLQLDPAEERSRATMWDVVRFAEHHHYQVVIVENVVEARWWTPFPAWLQAMELLGYRHKIVYLNSMFAHPTPQSRDRMYVVFWKKGLRTPNLDIRPRAHCPRCGRDVESVQSWKNPAKPWGKYGQQYLYRCPDCAVEVTPYYFAAFNAIDWTLPAPRIGDRARPLKEKTLKRIEIGLKKFARPMQLDLTQQEGRVRPLTDPAFTQVGSEKFGVAVPPFLVGNYSPGWVREVTQPTGTVTSADHHAVCVPPFTIETQWSHAQGDRSSGMTEALPTQTGQLGRGLVVPPFLVSVNHSTDRSRDVTEPAPTVMPQGNPGVVTPPYLVDLRGENAPRETTDPLSTVVSSGNHHGVVVPFLSSYYGTGDGSPIDEAVPTVPTRDRHALVLAPFLVGIYGAQGQKVPAPIEKASPTMTGTRTWALAQPGETPAVEDCGFRMLQPHEIGAAMAFPRSYTVLGNQREQVKQYGNAVTPPVMRMLVERVLEVLG